MKDKAVYKYGMHGDRNHMGKKGPNQKMGEYFPKQYNPDNPDNYYAGDVADGTAQKMEGAIRQEDSNIVKKGNRGRTRTVTDKKGKQASLTSHTSHRIKGTAINTDSYEGKDLQINDPMSSDFNPAGKAILGSETQYNLEGSGTEKSTEKLNLKIGNIVSYTNKRGKTKSAAGGTKKATKLRKKYNKQEAKIKKTGYKGQDPTDTGKVMNYKKGTIEYS